MKFYRIQLKSKRKNINVFSAVQYKTNDMLRCEDAIDAAKRVREFKIDLIIICVMLCVMFCLVLCFTVVVLFYSAVLFKRTKRNRNN